MPARALLKRTLYGNAIFSTLTGIYAVLQSDILGSTMRIPHEYILVSIGISLIIFAISVFLISLRFFYYKWILSVIILDWTWVLAISLIILMELWNLSSVAYIILGSISIPVLILAIIQTYYYRKAIG